MRPSTIRATNNPASAIVHLQNHYTILYIVTTCQVVTWAGTMRGPMGERSAETTELCRRFHHASELIGRRWTGAIIFVLLASRCRFATLRAAIPDITDRMLSERLQELEHEGIVVRIVVPETPVRVEYELTRKGRALASAIDAIVEWAHKWISLEAPARGESAAHAAGRAAERKGGRPQTPRRPSRARSTTS